MRRYLEDCKELYRDALAVLEDEAHVKDVFRALGWCGLESCIHNGASVWDSQREWAEEMLSMMDAIPEHLMGYIDYDKWALDAQLSGSVSIVESSGKIIVIGE